MKNPFKRRKKNLDRIAGSGMTPVTLGNRSGSNQSQVQMFSWRTIYDAFIEAGLSPEEAKKETDARVIRID